MTQQMGPRRLTGRMIVGAMFILVGLLFSLDNLGVLDAGRFWNYWPLILIVIGLAKVLAPRESGQHSVGVVLIVLGVFFQLQMLAWINWGFHEIWPLILVLIGGSLIWRSLRRRRDGPAVSSAPDLSELAFMGGSNRVIESQDFRGGDITAVMGGVELDLRRAKIAGESATIDLFALWGGIEIKVPEEWSVDIKGLPIMGGFESSARSSGGEVPTKKLIVRGTAIMGGVEIKN